MHLALRQKKFVCAHALLVMGARTDIKNDAGITQEDMIFQLTGKTLQLFRRESEVSHATKLLYTVLRYGFFQLCAFDCH